MYDNIGKKIKGLATATFIVEALASIIIGIVVAVIDNDLVLVSLLILLLGSFAAWVSSWLLYGFGELIDKTCDIAYNTRDREMKNEAQSNDDDKKINEAETLSYQNFITRENQQTISRD